MKRDPLSITEMTTIRAPAAQGPGSGKAAWQAFGLQVIDANEGLTRLIDRQSEVIRDLEAEVKLLRDQIASRKPKGGRPPLASETIDDIERALDTGQSTRKIAERHRVSAMTVSRVRKRVEARKAQLA